MMPRQVRQTNQVIELRFAKRRPYRDFRSERRQKAERQELQHQLAFVALCVIMGVLYVLTGSQ